MDYVASGLSYHSLTPLALTAIACLIAAVTLGALLVWVFTRTKKRHKLLRALVQPDIKALTSPSPEAKLSVAKHEFAYGRALEDEGHHNGHNSDIIPAIAVTVPIKPSVLLVDENGLFRYGIRLLLEREGWSVVGEACTADEGERLLSLLPSPTIVFCSTSLRDSSRLLKRLNIQRTAAAILIVDRPNDGARFQTIKGRLTVSITRLASPQIVLDVFNRVSNGVEWNQNTFVSRF